MTMEQRIRQFHPELDIDFTTWVQFIVNADIVIRNNKEDWTNDPKLIQIKQYSIHDLSSLLLESNNNNNEVTSDGCWAGRGKDDDGDDRMMLKSKSSLKEEQEQDQYHHNYNHPYEYYIDIIKLPMGIPLISTITKLPQFLFIRPDEYKLLTLLGKEHKNSLLTGSPGISKKFFQWKYILFCYRQDLFHILWSSKQRVQDIIERKKESSIRQDKINNNNNNNNNSNSEEDPPTTNNNNKESPTTEMIPPDHSKEDVDNDDIRMPFVPNYIIRTLGGEASYVFFVPNSNNNNPPKVVQFDHESISIDELTTVDSTLLWDPYDSIEPIGYTNIASHIIAIVGCNSSSSNSNKSSYNDDGPPIYQEYQKRSKTFYLPCFSLFQLRIIGLIYRECCDGSGGGSITDPYLYPPHLYPSDEMIRIYYNTYGPNIRIYFVWTDDERINYIRQRRCDIISIKIKKLRTIINDSSSSCDNNNTNNNNNIPIINDNNLIGLSNRLIIMTINRNHPRCYRTPSLIDTITCPEVLRLMEQYVLYRT